MIGTKDTFLYKLQCGSDTGMISWTYVPISTSGDENHLSIVTSHLQVPCCSTDNSSNTPTSRALFVRLGGVVKSFAQKKKQTILTWFTWSNLSPPPKCPRNLLRVAITTWSLNQFGIVQPTVSTWPYPFEAATSTATRNVPGSSQKAVTKRLMASAPRIDD